MHRYGKNVLVPPPHPQKIVKNQISQRLLTFFKEFDISSWGLHVACGFSDGFMGTLRRGSAGFTAETLHRIFKGFPELSPEWLILGQGEMLKKGSQKPKTNKTSNEKIINQLETIKATEAKLLENTQEMMDMISQTSSTRRLLKLQKESNKITALFLVQRQQLKKLIREYNERDDE